MKSLGVCYWYVKMPQCGCVEHGLAYTTFYVQKHRAHLAVLFYFPAGSRWTARGARICETPLLCVYFIGDDVDFATSTSHSFRNVEMPYLVMRARAMHGWFPISPSILYK